jgi:Lon protease-like protein
LLDYEEGEPYLQARVEFFDDESAFADFSAQTAEANSLFKRIANLAQQIKENEREEELPELPEDPEALSFMLAAYLDLSLSERQEMLELTDTGQRFERVIQQLREMADDYERRLRGRKISQVNGHGGKLPDF